MLLINMDEERSLELRSVLEMRHYESVVEQDHRLQMIRNPFCEDFKEIVILDKRVAKGDKLTKSHPMAIYLNKSSLCSKQSVKVNKNLIYKRMEAFPTSNEMDKLSRCSNNVKKYLMLKKQETIRRKMDIMKIEPRKRWNKLYDRKYSPLKAIQELLSVEISNKITQLLTVQPVMQSVKYRNVDCLLRKYERVSRTLIYRRCQLKTQREETCFPLIWDEPDSSNVIDEVSRDNLCHITLLCRDVICECDKCTTGCIPYEFSCGICQTNNFYEIIMEPDLQFSGSLAENCMLPIFYIQTDAHYSVKKCSDFDMMFYLGYKVGFDVNDSNIISTVDTDKSRPGYLRIREKGIGRLFGWLENTSDSSTKNIFFQNSHHGDTKYSQHGPATSITHTFNSMSEIDKVPYLLCPSWPPIAKSWIDRIRPSNWPSKETIQTIVSKGCRVVLKPHEPSGEDETEFRFSFSESERILFEALTCDQRKCFIAFKALMKFCIYNLEYKAREEINLSTYSLKTIFLWACETIPVDHWQTTNGWSICLLYMIDNLYACVKARQLPGYFIPENNLLDNLKHSGLLRIQIEKLRSHPISHAAKFIDATRCFRGFQSNIYDETNILGNSEKVRAIILIEQLIS